MDVPGSARSALVPSGDAAKTPVTIITGFLGAGKTTLLNYILKNRGGRHISVIENEFGEVNIDNKLVADNLLEREDLVSLDNGCVCCSLRKDVVKALAEIERRSRYRDKRIDQIILETTGLADPAPVAFTFFANPWIASRFRIDSIVCVCDTRYVLEHLDPFSGCDEPGAINEAAQQLAFADVILLNKTDLVNAEQLARVRRVVREINHSARQIECRLNQEGGRPPLRDLLDANAFSVHKALKVDPYFLDSDSASASDDDASDGEGENDQQGASPASAAGGRGSAEGIGERQGSGAGAAMAAAAVEAAAAAAAPAAEGSCKRPDAEAVAAAAAEENECSSAATATRMPDGQLDRLDSMDRPPSAFSRPPRVSTAARADQAAARKRAAGAGEAASGGFEVDGMEEGRSPKRMRKHMHDVAGIGSVGIVAHGPLDEYRFNMFMRDLLTEKAKDIFRCKGVLAVHGYGSQKFVFQGVHETICYGPGEKPWGEDEPRVNHIVFIGRGLDRKSLMMGFKTCVWKPLPEGWREAFDPVTKQPYYYNPTTKEKTWARPQQARPAAGAAGPEGGDGAGVTVAEAVTVTPVVALQQPKRLLPGRRRSFSIPAHVAAAAAGTAADGAAMSRASNQEGGGGGGGARGASPGSDFDL